MKSFTYSISLTALLISLNFTSCHARQESIADRSSAAVEVDESNSSKQAEDFVAKIGNEFLKVLINKDQPLKQRKTDFKKILFEYFDMPAIGKFVLSRHWRELSEDQRKQYADLFEQSVVENYASQFDHYDNQKLEVKNSRKTQDKGYNVLSHIVRPNGGAPLKVEWKVFQTKHGLRVLDIIVDGVSMSITLRSEYSSVYNDKGGIEGLFNYLKNKIENPEEYLTRVPG